MATIAKIPLNKIERVMLYINADRKTLEAIRAETCADYLLNGSLYDMSRWKPVMHFRADGNTYSSDEFNYNGLGWNDGPDIRSLQSKTSCRFAIFCAGSKWSMRGKRHRCITILRWTVPGGGL